MNESEKNSIFTIGHSNQSLEDFIKLLRDNNIQILVDVRSYPRSEFASQFDSVPLKKTLTEIGIKYLYFGREIGGRPDDPAFYDVEGYALYSIIAQSPSFVKTIDRLVQGLNQYRVAIMCSEEDPTECHRRLLIGRVLSQRGIEELHIRADGSVQSEKELSNTHQNRFQLSLFVLSKEEPWKSAKPIRLDSRNERQKNSSKS